VLHHQTLESESKKEIDDLKKQLAASAKEKVAKDRLIAQLQASPEKSAQVEAELKDKITKLETNIKEKNDELQQVSADLVPNVTRS
jgi:chromosome segregation ATPase